MAGAEQLRVVVADDDALYASTLARALSRHGFEVAEIVGDGAAAVAACVRHRPHVAVLDLRMPHMDGRAATLRIRALAPSPGVVVVTATAEEAIAAALGEAGAHALLSKSTGASEIAAAVRAAAAAA